MTLRKKGNDILLGLWNGLRGFDLDVDAINILDAEQSAHRGLQRHINDVVFIAPTAAALFRQDADNAERLAVNLDVTADGVFIAEQFPHRGVAENGNPLPAVAFLPGKEAARRRVVGRPHVLEVGFHTGDGALPVFVPVFQLRRAFMHGTGILDPFNALANRLHILDRQPGNCAGTPVHSALAVRIGIHHQHV